MADPLLGSPRTHAQSSHMDLLQDAPLTHQADYWHSRCNDLKTSLQQVKAELASVLERERTLTLRNEELETRTTGSPSMENEIYDLEEELRLQHEENRRLRQQVHHSGEMKRRIDSALNNARLKEELCERFREDLRSKTGDLEKAKGELQKLRTESAKEQEVHHRSMAELRAKLDMHEKNQQDFLTREEDFQREEQLHREAVSKIADLRQRLKIAQEQEAKHGKAVELLQSERDLWISRCEYYKKNYYDSLRHGLPMAYDAAMPISVPTFTIPTPMGTAPSTPSWRHFSRSSHAIQNTWVDGSQYRQYLWPVIFEHFQLHLKPWVHGKVIFTQPPPFETERRVSSIQAYDLNDLYKDEKRIKKVHFGRPNIWDTTGSYSQLWKVSICFFERIPCRTTFRKGDRNCVSLLFSSLVFLCMPDSQCV